MKTSSVYSLFSQEFARRAVQTFALMFVLTAGATGCRSLYQDQSHYGDVDWSQSLGSSGMLLDWPVDEARMTRGYLPKKYSRPHLGIDLASNKGTPILAAHDGVVVYTGKDFRGFGKMILIEGRGGWASLYAHLDKITIKQGTRVRKGEIIGGMGRTGRASGVHLHFELRKDKGPVDPLLYLPAGTHFANK